MSKKYEGALRNYEGKIEDLTVELKSNNISFIIVLDDNKGEGMTAAGHPREHNSYLIKRMASILKEHYRMSGVSKEPVH